jgi:hypothetical protein
VRLSDIRRRFPANEQKKELAAKKARQMAKMAAKAKHIREQKQAQEQQKWAQAQKHEEEESAKESEPERTADEHEHHKLREEAAKSDQPKCRKSTIDEAEDEEVGTSGVSNAVAEISTPSQAEDNRQKKRVIHSSLPRTLRQSQFKPSRRSASRRSCHAPAYVFVATERRLEGGSPLFASTSPLPVSLLEPRKECLPSRLPQAARKSPRHRDESVQILGPRSVSILNKMEPLPSLLYSMITRQRAKTNSYVSVLTILAPRARYCQTFSTLKWVPPSPNFQVVAGPLSTRRLHDILHLLVALLIVDIVVALSLHDILHLLIALFIVEIVVALCLHDIHHLRVALLGLLESREKGAANKRSERRKSKEKGLRYGGGGSLIEVRIGI